MAYEAQVQAALTSAGQHAGKVLVELGRLQLSEDTDDMWVYHELHSVMGDLAAAQAWLLHASAHEAVDRDVLHT